MRIVIDTSMIFSLLLGKNVKMRDTFFDPAHIFYAPNYIIGELFEKKEKIMRYSALSESEVYELFHRILGRIEFVAENFVALEHRTQAFTLCVGACCRRTPYEADCDKFGKSGGAAMDNTLKYRDIIKQTVLRYARLSPSHGNIRLDPVFDDKNDRYALMQTGWDRGRRVRGNLVYLLLHEDKVHIEYDGIGYGITDDLIRGGIPEDRIVLSYLNENAV